MEYWSRTLEKECRDYYVGHLLDKNRTSKMAEIRSEILDPWVLEEKKVKLKREYTILQLMNMGKKYNEIMKELERGYTYPI